MRRILITGSRDWPDPTVVERALDESWARLGGDPQTVLVSGSCPTGADLFAEQWAGSRGLLVERHPADWTLHGKAAGPLRNREMVELGADECIAFIHKASRGATGTAEMALEAGIPTLIYRT